MRAFLTADQSDIRRLLAIVDTYPNRNWDWLIQWVDGSLSATRSAPVEAVLRLYEDEQEWMGFSD